MTNFKPGDLVMVVKPMKCCGNAQMVGEVGILSFIPDWAAAVLCERCRRTIWDFSGWFVIAATPHHESTLKKIDPPAEGDSLPTRRDLEMPA